MAQIELLEPDRIADPYPWLAELRRSDPVHYDESLRGWLVTRYADVCDALADRRLRSGTFPDVIARRIGPDGTTGPVTAHRTVSRWLTYTDPPEHTRMRNAVKRAFTPRVVEALRPQIHELAEGLLAGRKDLVGVDLVAEYAFPLPAGVIGDLLGVPRADHPRFREWSDQIRPMIFIAPNTSDRYERAEQGFVALIGYLEDLVEQRRAHPADDLISRLLAAEGEDRLDDRELVAVTAHFLFAGHETTTNLIGNALFTLLRRPELLRRLRSDPEQLPSAIEELLRLESPVSLTTRQAGEDLDIGGRRIAAGDRVYLMLSAANRDPEEFAQPDELVLGRKPNAHLAFIRNIHFCLGAALARVEGEIALRTVLCLLPDDARDRLDYGWQDELSNRGLTHLRIRA